MLGSSQERLTITVQLTETEQVITRVPPTVTCPPEVRSIWGGGTYLTAEYHSLFTFQIFSKSVHLLSAVTVNKDLLASIFLIHIFSSDAQTNTRTTLGI